jgi:HAD superfamily hydrolase (TIGR01509 family)
VRVRGRVVVHGGRVMVHGVPEEQIVEAVLLDFHGTIVQVEDPLEWVLAAAAECGATLDIMRATWLADRLVTAGRAGGPVPTRVPPQLAEAWADRDLTPASHRAAFAGLAATVDAGIDGFADALYERCRRPEGWRVYEDTAPTLRALYAAGVPVAVVSNIGFDIRELCVELGFAKYVSAWVLSYEVGHCKPDVAIFRYACRALGVEPARALMVGDTPADAAAVVVGCRTLVLPSAPPGGVNGLDAVLALALPANTQEPRRS